MADVPGCAGGVADKAAISMWSVVDTEPEHIFSDPVQSTENTCRPDDR
jgi:hypothetical protein